MVSTKTLALAALASMATANDFMLDRRQNLNAQSVSTADFKSRFEQSGIVPEVIAALDPMVSFYASYKTVDGRDAVLVPGSTLTASEAMMPFEFMVENLNNVTGITTGSRYLIYLLDADAPSRADPSARNMRHYLAGNYTLANSQSSLLPTAVRLFLPSTLAAPFTPFQQPSPTANTGVHRYVYALYVQPDRFLNSNFDSAGMSTQTTNWDLPQWRMQLGLGPAIGATFFSIDTGVNNGQGVSSQVDPTAGLASGLSAPRVFALTSAAALVALALV